jgi:hypothetical protein
MQLRSLSWISGKGSVLTLAIAAAILALVAT